MATKACEVVLKAFLTGAPLFACASASAYEPNSDLGTNSVNGQAERTTGQPNFLRMPVSDVLRPEAGTPMPNSSSNARKVEQVPSMTGKNVSSP
mgnify:CR=1 FL=1